MAISAANRWTGTVVALGSAPRCCQSVMLTLVPCVCVLGCGVRIDNVFAIRSWVVSNFGRSHAEFNEGFNIPDSFDYIE